jgi:hypothetical protein
MESIYHIVAIRVNETSCAHVWRLRSRYLRMGCDNMSARQLCPKLNLKIRGIDFVANLIVLDSKGIDVIFVMYWLSKHEVLIDCARKSIKLT